VTKNVIDFCGKNKVHPHSENSGYTNVSHCDMHYNDLLLLSLPRKLISDVAIMILVCSVSWQRFELS